MPIEYSVTKIKMHTGNIIKGKKKRDQTMMMLAHTLDGEQIR